MFCAVVLQGYDNPEKVVEVWLGCVIATQYLSDRLLMEIQAVEYHMRFWQHRLKAGTQCLPLKSSACKAVAVMRYTEYS